MKLTRRTVIGGLAALFAAGGVVGWLKRMSSGVYGGPVSDHFDGTHFVGPYAVPGKGAAAFWQWQLNRDKAKWPERVENRPVGKPPARLDDGLRVTWIGHASLLIQAGGLNVLIDPVWSERATPFSIIGPKRMRD